MAGWGAPRAARPCRTDRQTVRHERQRDAGRRTADGPAARMQARFPVQGQRKAVRYASTYLSPARYPTPMLEGT